jgi:rubrerythrin
MMVLFAKRACGMTMDESMVDYEILELAIAREVDANRFYMSLAARTQKPHIRRIFEELAAEELEHKAKLEFELIKTGRVVNTSEEIPGLNDDQPDSAAPDFVIDFKDILLIGIQKEEASVRLYTDMAGMVTDAESKRMLLALAAEEVKHKDRFQAGFNRLFQDR